MASNMQPERPAVPHPDPTVLTTQALIREIEALRDEMKQQDDCLREVIETRLDGMDKAIGLIQSMSDRIPSSIDTRVNNLRELVTEQLKTVDVKFDGVQNQFLEREVRVRDSALANTTAINAALQSQKEAAGEQAKSFTLSIDKSEKGTLEQINQQRVLLESATQGTTDKIGDLKDRVARIESTAVTQVMAKADVGVARTQGQMSNSFMLALFVAGISLIGLIAALARGGG